MIRMKLQAWLYWTDDEGMPIDGKAFFKTLNLPYVPPVGTRLICSESVIEEEFIENLKLIVGSIDMYEDDGLVLHTHSTNMDWLTDREVVDRWMIAQGFTEDLDHRPTRGYDEDEDLGCEEIDGCCPNCGVPVGDDQE